MLLRGKTTELGQTPGQRRHECPSNVHRATGFTQICFLVFGHEVNVPTEILIGIPEVNSKAQTPAEHAVEQIEILRKSHEAVRKNLQATQLRQKKLYDVKVKQSVYQIGELVYKLDSSTKIGQSKKLQPVFMGPYLITEVLSPVLYRIEGRKKSSVVHHDRLIICRDRSIPFWLRTKRHPYLVGKESEEKQKLVEPTVEDGELRIGLAEELFEEEEGQVVMDHSRIVEGEMGEAEEEGVGKEGGEEEVVEEVLRTQEVSNRVATRSGRMVNRPDYLKNYVE